jgi:alginate O-acetyltransferase complex protein AlgI
MLFNSADFICYFLPIVFVSYYALRRAFGISSAKGFLVIASLFFYGWWKLEYLPLLLGSIVFNYGVGRYLVKTTALRGINPWRHKCLLIIGITLNLGLLGYYKYSGFAIEVVNGIAGSSFSFEALLLPLAISFFTFQQIAFLVDAYTGKVDDFEFGNYALFVSFFPQLIAGPIVHHKEMMPQFKESINKWLGWQNISAGIRIFVIGLAKKLIIADTLAKYADAGWAQTGSLTFFDGWATTLCYTFQLYFDFSGYSDMAIGAACLFGVRLPQNFNSPYKALNLQDFWKRWHMTLSRWLRDYVYIPLGGNRRGNLHIYRNLFLTFLIGGIWHGAGWTFIIWGIMHGTGCIIYRLWSLTAFTISRRLAWLITFLYVHIGWIFFRAPSMEEGLVVTKSLFGINGIILSYEAVDSLNYLIGYNLFTKTTTPWSGELPIYLAAYLACSAFIAFKSKNSYELSLGNEEFNPIKSALWTSCLCLICYLTSVNAVESPFLYFNF